MSSKYILAGAIATAVVGAASAGSVKAQSQKQSQANLMANVIGQMVQTINTPECSIHSDQSDVV